MMWRYIGEDVVLNLLGRNPYEMNWANYHITYNPQTYRAAKEIAEFFTSHIPADRIVELKVGLCECDDAVRREICKQIVVLNDFGGHSEVDIIYGKIIK